MLMEWISMKLVPRQMLMQSSCTIIIKDSKVVSMKVLQHVYGDDSEDKRYRRKLKQKIQKEFTEILQFVQPSNVYA